MSNWRWIKSLRQTLRSLAPPDQPARVAILGVGHELRGDDGAGPAVAQALRAFDHTLQFPSDQANGERRITSLIIDVGPAPENFTGSLRRFRPDLVLIVDAAEMGERPGTVRWLSWQETTGIGVATHALPVHVLATYLSADLGCDLALIGIQPNNTAFGSTLSPRMQRAVGNVAKALAGELTRSSTMAVMTVA